MHGSGDQRSLRDYSAGVVRDDSAGPMDREARFLPPLNRSKLYNPAREILLNGIHPGDSTAMNGIALCATGTSSA